jgi:hypothetical protein
MRKKRHRPNRKFTPKPVSKSFSRNPNNKGKPKTSATIHQLKQPNKVEHPPIVGGCWVIDGDTIHIDISLIIPNHFDQTPTPGVPPILRKALYKTMYEEMLN